MLGRSRPPPASRRYCSPASPRMAGSMCRNRCRRPISRRCAASPGCPMPSWRRGRTEAAYGTFGHAAVAPLVQLDERLWLLELFHGPTLAFKDLALQLLGQLFDAALARRGERVTVVGATSGDTGSAAIEACRDRAAIDIFMLYPHGRVSEVQ